MKPEESLAIFAQRLRTTIRNAKSIPLHTLESLYEVNLSENQQGAMDTILSVFVGADLVSIRDRIDGSAVIVDNDVDSVNREIEQRCAFKRKQLVQKLRALSLYKALGQRNRHIPKPNNAIQVPVIILEIPKTDNAFHANQLNCGLRLTFGATVPHFYSPVDVFNRIGFSKQTRQQMIQEIPGLECLAELACEDDENV